MHIKRTVASLLVLTTMVNLCPITTAETAEITTQKHTVTWTMDADSYTLKPITGSRTAMVDEGSRLINAKGEAETEIQTTYYRDRTLASVSMNGTGFSFSPIMLEEYYPQEISEETEDTEISEDIQEEEQPELEDEEEQTESFVPNEEIDDTAVLSCNGGTVSRERNTTTAKWISKHTNDAPVLAAENASVKYINNKPSLTSTGNSIAEKIWDFTVKIFSRKWSVIRNEEK